MSAARGFGFGVGLAIGALMVCVLACGGCIWYGSHVQANLEKQAENEFKAIAARPINSAKDVEEVKREWRKLITKYHGTRAGLELQQLLAEWEADEVRDKAKALRQRVGK